MNKAVILLRHAHAEPATRGQEDSDRPLSARGVAEAEGAGAWLKSHPTLPARILCSPSRRTRETLQYALGNVEAKIEPRIYEATAGELVALIDEHSDVDHLLLVGHNPGFETLAALLTTGQSGDFRGIPPGGVVWIDHDEGAVEPGAGKLKAFWAP